MAAAHWQDAALILELQIQPGAAQDEFVGLHGDRIRIRITAPPVDGRANAHLLRYLANSFGTSRADISLVRGKTGRSKTVRIAAPALIPPIVAELLGIATTTFARAAAASRKR